jgi:hypothetical protein
VWVRQVSGRSVTDTTDSALHGNPANKGNYGNCTRRTDSLVTRSKHGVLSRQRSIHRHRPEMAVMCSFSAKDARWERDSAGPVWTVAHRNNNLRCGGKGPLRCCS